MTHRYASQADVERELRRLQEEKQVEYVKSIEELALTGDELNNNFHIQFLKFQNEHMTDPILIQMQSKSRDEMEENNRITPALTNIFGWFYSISSYKVFCSTIFRWTILPTICTSEEFCCNWATL